jgi:hypothetical protein
LTHVRDTEQYEISVGGCDAPFFSEGLLRETAEKIPDETLHVCEGVGHGVPKGRKLRYENDTIAFLDDRLRGLSRGVGLPVSTRVKEMR